jgi:hypothetical protein
VAATEDTEERDAGERYGADDRHWGEPMRTLRRGTQDTEALRNPGEERHGGQRGTTLGKDTTEKRTS